MVINFLRKLPPKAKKALIDENMCNCVKSMVNELVDMVWPDIEEEILFQLRMQLSAPEIPPDVPPKFTWYCCLCKRFRACFRYNYYPVDRTSWQQFKNFWYWVIVLIQLIPYFAVQPIFKLFVWLMIDKSDEFQLIKFILDFKSL